MAYSCSIMFEPWCQRVEHLWHCRSELYLESKELKIGSPCRSEEFAKNVFKNGSTHCVINVLLLNDAISLHSGLQHEGLFNRGSLNLEPYLLYNNNHGFEVATWLSSLGEMNVRHFQTGNLKKKESSIK